MEISEIFLTALQALSVLALLGNLMGNFLVFAVIHKVKSMQTNTNYLLWNLALNDFQFGVVAFIEIVRFYALRKPRTRSYSSYEISLHFYASSFTLTAIAVERYYAILKPFVHRAKMSNRLLKRVLLCIWILALLLNMPEWFMGPVEEAHIRDIYILSAYITCLSLSAAGMATCYSKVVYRVWFKTEERQTTNAGLLKSRKRLTKLLVAVTLIFFACWCPLLGRGLIKSAENERFYIMFSGTLALVGTAVNPVLYSLHSARFRQALRKLFGGCWKNRSVGNIQARPIQSVETLDSAL